MHNRAGYFLHNTLHFNKNRQKVGLNLILKHANVTDTG